MQSLVNSSNANEIREQLNQASHKILRIEFTKKNGENRVLIGTKNFDFIPPVNHPKGVMNAKNDDITRIYDLQNNGWRSVRHDSVISVQPDTYHISNDEAEE
jgi:hypothetical protein